jgi:hypothetical protein
MAVVRPRHPAGVVLGAEVEHHPMSVAPCHADAVVCCGASGLAELAALIEIQQS